MDTCWTIEIIRIDDKESTKKWGLTIEKIAYEFDREQRLWGYKYVNENIDKHHGMWIAEDETGGAFSRIHVTFGDDKIRGNNLFSLFDPTGERKQLRGAKFAVGEWVDMRQSPHQDFIYRALVFSMEYGNNWYYHLKLRESDPVPGTIAIESNLRKLPAPS